MVPVNQMWYLALLKKRQKADNLKNRGYAPFPSTSGAGLNEKGLHAIQIKELMRGIFYIFLCNTFISVNLISEAERGAVPSGNILSFCLHKNGKTKKGISRYRILSINLVFLLAYTEKKVQNKAYSLIFR